MQSRRFRTFLSPPLQIPILWRDYVFEGLSQRVGTRFAVEAGRHAVRDTNARPGLLEIARVEEGQIGRLRFGVDRDPDLPAFVLGRARQHRPS